MSSEDDSPGKRNGKAYGVPAKRARIIELLSDAYARDDLEQAEFERRLEAAERAATIEELDELVSDFPAEILNALQQPQTANGAASLHPTQGQGALSGKALDREIARLNVMPVSTTLNIIGDSHILIKPEGPRVAKSVSLLGDCNVDLRALAGKPGAALIKIFSLLGDTRILVPKGTNVETKIVSLIGDQTRAKPGGGLFKRLAKRLGFIEHSAEDPAPLPGPPVVVTGFKLIGDIVIVEE